MSLQLLDVAGIRTPYYFEDVEFVLRL